MSDDDDEPKPFCTAERRAMTWDAARWIVSIYLIVGGIGYLSTYGTRQPECTVDTDCFGYTCLPTQVCSCTINDIPWRPYRCDQSNNSHPGLTAWEWVFGTGIIFAAVFLLFQCNLVGHFKRDRLIGAMKEEITYVKSEVDHLQRGYHRFRMYLHKSNPGIPGESDDESEHDK